MAKAAFATNPFQQRLLERDALAADPKWEKKMKEGRQEQHKIHGNHCDTIKSYLHKIEKLIDEKHKGHDGKSEEKDTYDVDNIKKVHDRVKDVHDHLDHYKGLPLRTVSEDEESPATPTATS